MNTFTATLGELYATGRRLHDMANEHATAVELDATLTVMKHLHHTADRVRRTPERCAQGAAVRRLRRISPRSATSARSAVV